MKFHELELESKKSRKRVGRGISGGQGKTAGRGTKGQKARTGKKLRPGFEGGQNRLGKRIPKLRGFTPYNATKVQIVKTSELNKLPLAKKIDSTTLKEAGLIKSVKLPVKLLYDGDLEKQFTIDVQNASAKAVSAAKKANAKLTLKPLEKAKNSTKK
ncbi:MAG: 50S ribosomal protein L15 [Candidatus Saccharimonadales bacterium]